MGLLDGKIAVVTGAGRGIGRGFALELAREGAKVVVNDVGCELDGRGTTEDPAFTVCREIEKDGGQATPNYDDVATFAGGAAIVQTAVDAFGGVDILVNNAGIVRDRSLLKMTEEEFHAVLGVHLVGTFNTARHAAPIMKERGYGRIINITSSAGLRGNFGQTNYAAAKAGIMGMTLTWAIELGKYGITSNAVAPVASTRMTAAIVTGEMAPDMDPNLNAPLISFLASEKAAHINGQIFGRRGYGYTIFQKPKPIAVMYKDGGWTASDIASSFDSVLGEYMMPPGLDVVIKPPAKDPPQT